MTIGCRQDADNMQTIFKPKYLEEVMSEKETVTRGELVKAAKELNDVLFEEGDKQRIDVKANAKVLDQKLREASTLLADDDEMSEETLATLKTIGADLPESMGGTAGGTEEGNEETSMTESEEQEEGTVEVIETEKIDTTAQVKSAKAAKKIPELQAIAKEMGVRIAPPFLKDLKKCRDYVVEKLQKLATEGRPVKKEKIKKERKAGVRRGRKLDANAYTRSHALVDALKKGGTRDDIVKYSDELFVEKGGKTNTNVANYMFGYVYNTLLIIGQISEADGVFSWNN